MLLTYGKGRREDLTRRELAELRALTKAPLGAKPFPKLFQGLCTHLLKRPGLAVRSPADLWGGTGPDYGWLRRAGGPKGRRRWQAGAGLAAGGRGARE